MFSKFPLDRLTSNIPVLRLFIFKVIHILEDILDHKTTNHWLVIIFHVEQFYTFCLLHSHIPVFTSSQHLSAFFFFFHHQQHTGSFITSKGKLFTSGALSRNASQHVEKDSVPASLLQIDYFDEVLAALFSKLCL